MVQITIINTTILTTTTKRCERGGKYQQVNRTRKTYTKKIGCKALINLATISMSVFVCVNVLARDCDCIVVLFQHNLIVITLDLLQRNPIKFAYPRYFLSTIIRFPRVIIV